MNILLRRAEEILEIAVRGAENVAIVIDRQGGVKMMDPSGWSLPSLRVECGAAMVYKVERYAGTVRVEGWDGVQSCVLKRPAGGRQPGAPLGLTAGWLTAGAAA